MEQLGAAEAERLRRLLRAAQDGSAEAYAAALGIAAARARQLALRQQGGASVQQALQLLHRLRHTYDPARCPLRWMDSVIGAAMADARPEPEPVGEVAVTA